LSRRISGRSELEVQVGEQLGRRLSARALLFHQAVAERLGLNPTDLKCLDLARTESDVTAGRLAELTGLTTAAVTTVIDRLEASGLVRRVRDASDRRKVLVRPVPERAAEVGKLFDSLNKAMMQLCAEYSVNELTLIRDFATRLDDLMQSETRKLREAKDGQNA
jgi:DNA-binding MarR family transcriptional regulator